MDVLSGLVQALPILGLVSLITLLVKNWLNSKERQADRLYGEKREAFIGLLKSMGDHVASGTEETLTTFAYWRMRCEIVSSQATREAIAKAIAKRVDEGHKQPEINEIMLSAIRRELGIAL
ncbi:hypothetical protein [uncultured Roseobacter sp.]|uniref:hypothetical protein n=1 Tax=uncultured Roseobacter sp. TaxID=114847 RepID=UPI002607A6F6|nr:hypothetical protein [uncultured Roseobacter sp.]